MNIWLNFILVANKPIFNIGLAAWFDIFDEKKWDNKASLHKLRDALARLNQVNWLLIIIIILIHLLFRLMPALWIPIILISTLLLDAWRYKWLLY